MGAKLEGPEHVSCMLSCLIRHHNVVWQLERRKRNVQTVSELVTMSLLMPVSTLQCVRVKLAYTDDSRDLYLLQYCYEIHYALQPTMPYRPMQCAHETGVIDAAIPICKICKLPDIS